MKIKRLAFMVSLGISVFVFSILNYGVASASVGAGTQSSTATQTALSSVDSASTLADIQAAMGTFLAQYSLSFDTACPASSTCISLSDANIAQTRILSRDFIEEWSKYPVSWITYTDLTKIIFVDDYKYLGVDRAAAPLNGIQSMLYDISYASEPIDSYMREVIHHEYGHYFEFFRTGSFYTPDATWSEYNSPIAGFSYGTGGGSCYDTPPPSYCVGSRPNGFVTPYSTSGLEEDKAEIYAYLMSTQDNVSLSDWVSEDPILVNKANNYKALLASIEPSMNVEYFKNIHGYFAEHHTWSTYTNDAITKELTDSSATALSVFDNRITIVNGSRGATTVYQGGILKGRGTVGLLSVNTGGHLAPGNSPGCLNAGNTTINGIFDVEVGGTTACTEYDQLKVTGTVDVTNGTLNVSRFNNFTPAVGQSYTIIDNDSNDAVSGTFSGLAQGATFQVDGYSFVITYVGGDGNDVVVTVTAVPAGAPGAAPGTPNTGVKFIFTHPLLTLAGTTLFAGVLIVLAQRYELAGAAQKIKN